MKKVAKSIRLGVLGLAAVATISFAYVSPSSPAEKVSTENHVTSSFKILNDTGSKVRIHTGSGVVSLNKGGSTSVSCSTGKKVYTAPNGSKDKFLFKIESSMCGKTVKLSKYM